MLIEQHHTVNNPEHLQVNNYNYEEILSFLFSSTPDTDYENISLENIDVHQACCDIHARKFMAFITAYADHSNLQLQFERNEEGTGMLQIIPAVPRNPSYLPNYNGQKAEAFIMEGERNQYPEIRQQFNQDYQEALSQIDPEWRPPIDPSLRR